MNSIDVNRSKDGIIIVSVDRWKTNLVKDFIEQTFPEEQKATVFTVISFNWKRMKKG